MGCVPASNGHYSDKPRGESRKISSRLAKRAVASSNHLQTAHSFTFVGTVFTNRQPYTVGAFSDNKHWHVWKTIEILETEGIRSEKRDLYQDTTLAVASVLRCLTISDWMNTGGKSFLNKRNLHHEVEESIVALHHLREWVMVDTKTENFIAVDVCCGKGCFSVLLSYLVGFHWKNEFENLDRVVLLDKESTSIDWSHIELANDTHEQEKRPFLELWKGTNLFEYDELIERFQSLQSPLALTGIHLCRNLSPSLVELANGLGPEVAPYLCLAPCCLPRLARSTRVEASALIIPIPAFETSLYRGTRLQAARQRKITQRRSQCYVCQGDHTVRDCPRKLNYSSQEEWAAKVKESLLSLPCWNCGQPGHAKSECTRAAISTVPQAMLAMDVLPAMSTTGAPSFKGYCGILSQHIQDSVSIAVACGKPR